MASGNRTPKAGLDVSPPDDRPADQLIEQYVPQLSLADLEAVARRFRTGGRS